MPEAGSFGGISETYLSDLSGCRVGGHLSITLSDKNIILFTIIPFLIAVNVVYLFLCFLESMKGSFAVEIPGHSPHKKNKIEHKFAWSIVVTIVGMYFVGLNSVPGNPGSSAASYGNRPGIDYPEPGSPADVYGDTNETGPDTVLLPNGKRYGRRELEAYPWKK